jgi:predicted RNA-binding Zn-ribbon protein involved in translation (DUF1610 family)
MEGHCSICGAQQQSPWKFCPLCGAASEHEIRKTEAEKPEHSPATGAFEGLFFGVIAAPILIIVGTMLCLTGLGAILGIPMIIAAVFAPLMGPMIGMGAVRGKCPSCGIPLNCVANAKDFECNGCGARIAIRHREFIMAG